MGADINSKFGLLLGFLVLLSCGQTEQIGNKLTEDEIDNLRARATAKCLSDTNSSYADFISTSNETMLDYRRDDNEWNLQYKVGTNVVKTHKIFVWKRTPTAIYFRILTSESTPKNIFLKYSLVANNDLMRQVQNVDCANQTYVGTVTSSSVTLKKDDSSFTTNNADTKYKIFRTFSFVSSQPGFFGFLKFKFTKQYYDNDGDTVSTPAAENESYEITTLNEAEQNSDTYTSNADYPNRTYCLVLDYTAAHIDVTTLSNLQCDNSSDAPTVTVGTETFTPATELINPESIQ